MRAVQTSRWCLVVLMILWLAQVACADLIFLKDGFSLQGRVRREYTREFDPVGREFIDIPKGFFSLDDGARWIYFSPSQVRVVEKLPPPMEERIVSRNVRIIKFPRNMLPIDDVLETGPWDVKTWERDYFFKGPLGRVGERQAIAALNPHYVRVDGINKFVWSSAYLTREFDPGTLEKLLANYPEFQTKPKDTAKQAVARRMRLCDFYAQASLFTQAERQLQDLAKAYPEEKERLDAAGLLVRRLRIRDEWEEIKKWHQAGRWVAVAKRLAEFPTKDAPEQILADVRELQGQLKAALERVDETRKALVDHQEKVDTPMGRSLSSAVTRILSELHPVNVDRLDAYLGQSREAQRRVARNQKPQMNTEELLSLAVTGWLLGSSSAEAKPQAAVNLWKTRQMILQYLNDSDPGARGKILAEYQDQVTPSVPFDEVAQIIDSLPPIQADLAPPTTITEVKVVRGRSATSYLFKLPPEYTPNRSYPILIVLGDAGVKPQTAMEPWLRHAAEHGYILACPNWSGDLASEYGYSQHEQDAVLDTIRDLQRRYQVDSDRVFLFGLREGGKMAYDVGLSHPHLFAGVMPMSAGPVKFPRRYWRNAQFLPFYVVTGSRSPDTGALLRAQFENWVLRGFPALWVSYKGRGNEFFVGELPTLFEWMRYQKRRFPMRQLGEDGGGGTTGTEFCTMRAEDNRFYWLGFSKIATRHLNAADRWNNQLVPASVTARVDAEANHVYIKASGVSGFTLWFGRNPTGQYLIDMDKPLTVSIGPAQVIFKRKVSPSLTVMLEELYKRGDRKHLYVGKIDVPTR